MAFNNDINQNIMESARSSCTSIVMYRKWNNQERRFQRKRYEVVPIDQGITPRGNKVLFVQDCKDHNQIKMFIINRISSFEKTKRKVMTKFPIQVQKLKRVFGG